MFSSEQSSEGPGLGRHPFYGERHIVNIKAELGEAPTDCDGWVKGVCDVIWYKHKGVEVTTVDKAICFITADLLDRRRTRFSFERERKALWTWDLSGISKYTKWIWPGHLVWSILEVLQDHSCRGGKTQESLGGNGPIGSLNQFPRTQVGMVSRAHWRPNCLHSLVLSF